MLAEIFASDAPFPVAAWRTRAKRAAQRWPVSSWKASRKQ
jgi:hypothetical protein